MSLPLSGRAPALQPQPTPAMSPAAPTSPADGQHIRTDAQVAPRLRQAVPPVDPRGVKRAREDGDVVVIGSSQEPSSKCARTDAVAKFGTLNDDQRVLVEAIAGDNLEKLTALLAQSPDLANAMLPYESGPSTISWKPPLQCAACLGKAGIVDALIRAGSRIDLQIEGWTALKLAAWYGHVEVIDRLIRHGADIHFISSDDSFSRSALSCAVKTRKLDASIYLIQLGAKLQQPYKLMARSPHGGQGLCTFTPLIEAIQSGFADLIDWLLKVGRLRPDTLVQTTGHSAFTYALGYAPLSVVKVLIEQGANLDVELSVSDSKCLKSVWQIAEYLKRFDVVELLLQRGMSPMVPTIGGLPVDTARFSDLKLYSSLLTGVSDVPADGLTDSLYRDAPESMITAMVRHAPIVKSESGRPLPAPLETIGLSHFLLAKLHAQTNFRGCQNLLGRNPWKPYQATEAPKLTTAQGMKAYAELVSMGIHATAAYRPFSGCGLSAEGEAAMNRVVHLQCALLLKGVANVRAQFDAQLATLPDIAVNRFISLSGQLNQRDLYRVLTKDWGLYDPLARAAIRLVEVAYQKLRATPESAMPASFAALPPAARLKEVIANVLTDWDKIDELVTCLREANSIEQLDRMTELLFMQWRHVCAAFGVEKPAWVPPEQRALADATSASSAMSSSASSGSASSSRN